MQNNSLGLSFYLRQLSVMPLWYAPQQHCCQVYDQWIEPLCSFGSIEQSNDASIRHETHLVCPTGCYGALQQEQHLL